MYYVLPTNINLEFNDRQLDVPTDAPIHRVVAISKSLLQITLLLYSEKRYIASLLLENKDSF